MIIINPQAEGKKHIEVSPKYFPHLFDENGKRTKSTFIYTLFDDIIVETVEDIETIRKKIKSYILFKIECLETENTTNNNKINKLKLLLNNGQ